MSAKSRLLIAGLLLQVLALSLPASAFDLDSLLARSIGGGEALDSVRALKTYRIEGVMVLNGTEGRYVEYFKAPNKLRSQLEFPEFEFAQGFDGQTAWKVDHNGQPLVLSGAEAAEILRSVFVASFSYLIPERIPSQRKYLGINPMGQPPRHKVVFIINESDSILTWYDEVTGHNVMAVSKLDDMVLQNTNDDFRLVGGILWPFRQTLQAIGAPLTMDLTCREIAINVPLDDSLFRIPESRAADFHFPAGSSAVTIPINYHNGHLKVTATINGRTKAWFILDSGASANMFNRSLAEELELTAVGSMAAKGLGGYEEITLVQTDSITIGDLTLIGQVAGSLELGLLGGDGPEGLQFGGVLGYDFLSRFPINIDYHNSLLTVYNPEAFVPPSGGVEIPFHLTLSIPTVTATLEGIEGEYIVDLGNPFGLIIHPLFAEASNLVDKLDHVRDVGMAIGGIGGEIGSRTGFAEQFRLGGVELSGLTVLLAEGAGGLTQSEDLAGNIGNLVLENFRVLLDYAGRRLILYQADG